MSGKYTLKLKWRSNDPVKETNYWTDADECIYTASVERFYALVKRTEELIEWVIQEYGIFWKDYFSPYQRIELYEGQYKIKEWTLKRYLERRNNRKYGN